MKIILTLHAKIRMAERGISFDSIKDTIELPDYTVSKDSKIEAHRKINGKVLKVVYSKEGNYIKVITLVWK